jgi:phosphatidylinositol-3-phosphatase
MSVPLRARLRDILMATMLAGALYLAGCGALTTSSTPSFSPSTSNLDDANAADVAQGTAAKSSHVAVVVIENMSYESVIGSSAAPYLNSLAAQYGLATQYYANTHPSIGNYFMLTTGQILTNDDGFTGTVSADNVVRELVRGGKSWKSYAESLPSVGYTGGNVGSYLKRHNPFAYFTDVVGTAQAANLVPFPQLAADLETGSLPDYSFIVPNVYDDGHNCPVAIPNCTVADKLSAADTWLRANLAPLLASRTATVIILWDEGDGGDSAHGGGHIVTIVAGPRAKAGYRSNTFYQHQSALRLTMELLGVPTLPGAAGTAPSMAEFFLSPCSQQRYPLISRCSQ